VRAFLFLLLALGSASIASAQDTVFGESHFIGDRPVDVLVRWGDQRGRPHGTVTVRSGDAVREVHSGGPAYAWAAANDRGVLVALVGASATVEVAFTPIAEGRPGRVVRNSLRRLAGEDRSPVGAAVASRPDGFAVFWQEASTSNPQSLYETYLARFDQDGRPSGESMRVNAAWPIADVVWTPAQGQYYFLLYYGGGDPRGTRLCGVHIDEQSLTNVEHPFWVSRPGMIDEARLVTNGSRVFAVYRDDDQIFETEVTAGTWGQEPAGAPRSHGRAGANVAYGLRASGSGIEVRVRPLGD